MSKPTNWCTYPRPATDHFTVDVVASFYVVTPIWGGYCCTGCKQYIEDIWGEREILVEMA